MKKFLFPRICNSYMGYSALLSLACFIVSIFLGDFPWVYRILALTCPLPLIFTLTRYYVKNFFLFVFIHILPVAVCFFIPLTLGAKLALCAFTITITLVSVYEKMKERLVFEVYTVAYAAFVGILQFFCGFLSKEHCLKLTLMCTIIYVVLYVTARGFYNLETFVSENRDLSNFPLKRIKASGIAVNTIFPLGFVLLLAFIPYEKVDYLFKNVSNALYKAFFFLMQLLPFEGNGEILTRQEEIMTVSGNMNRQQQDMMSIMGIPATNAFIKFLGHFGLFCSYIIVAGLVIFLLRLLWRFIYIAYGKYGKGEDNTIDIRESLEKVYVKAKEKKKVTLKERFSTQNKIREKFRKMVIKENKNKSIRGKTPTELVSDLTLVENYEIIRYGNDSLND